MSHSQRKPPKSPASHSKESVNKAVQDLNSQIDQLAQNILPRQPYLLSIPSDVPYRHSSRFVNNWHGGTPFKCREEQLQYVSFLPHQEDHEELLKVEGGWWDDRGQMVDEDLSPKTASNSGRNTPLDPSQRKKISLKDYKTKDKMPSPEEPSDVAMKTEHTERANGVDGTTDEHTSREDIKANPLESLKVEEPKTVEPRASGPSGLDGTSSPKSPPATMTDHESPRPAKRRKLSESPHLDTKRTPEKADINQIPRLLSPTLPSPDGETGLPELLSPLLPPTLVKAIATPPPSTDYERTSSHHRSESVRSILANAIGEGSPRPNGKSGDVSGSLGGSRVRSDSQHSVRSTTSVLNARTLAGGVKATEATSKPGTPQISATRSPRPRQRHVICLKYGKKNRKLVEALLKFKSRPKKIPPNQAELASETRSKPVSVKEPSKSKVAQGSPSDSPVKQKPAASPLESVKRPSTPVPSKVRDVTSAPSPSLSKSTYNTPKKELKSTAMRRVESTDGGDPSTPRDGGRGSTPLGAERNSLPPKMSPAPSSAPSVIDEGRHAWTKVNQAHFQLGRTIKHEGQALAEKDPARSLLLLIEALVCFMVNLAAQACSRPTVDPGWRTILPYHIFVFRASRKFPLLHGLVVQLGAVSRHLIHNHDLERLGRDPLPDEHLGSAPTPGSDGNTKTNEDVEKYKKKYLAFRDELVQNARELQTAWLDGSRCLSLEALQRDFPSTWAARSKESVHRGTERPTPTKMATGYFLPLDPASTAFEAAQYALAVLVEWADNEDVDWRPRVDL